MPQQFSQPFSAGCQGQPLDGESAPGGCVSEWILQRSAQVQLPPQRVSHTHEAGQYRCSGHEAGVRQTRQWNLSLFVSSQIIDSIMANLSLNLSSETLVPVATRGFLEPEPPQDPKIPILLLGIFLGYTCLNLVCGIAPRVTLAACA